jgi:molybdopterin synthase catalytic subunit
MFRLDEAAIDPAALTRELAQAGAGACASFEGWVRDHNEGRAVLRLGYQAYVPLAQAEGERILAEARERFAILDARCVHRIGTLEIGELAVWVGVSAAHRGAAFDACRYVIDEVKRRVPIWKNEHYADGESGWLHPDNRPITG